MGLIFLACDSATPTLQQTLSIVPSSVELRKGGLQKFLVEGDGDVKDGVAWSITSGPGHMSPDGTYWAPGDILEDSIRVGIRATSISSPNTYGEEGLLLRKGRWQKLDSGTQETLNAVSFLDSDWGFAVGNNGTLLQTVDGGQQWSLVSTRTTSNLHAVIVFDHTLYIAGDDGAFMKTQLPAFQWSSVSINPKYGITSVYFGESLGVAVGSIREVNSSIGYGSVAINSSCRWSTGELPTAIVPKSVFMLNRMRGFMVGDCFDFGFCPPPILQTKDGGDTWQVVLESVQPLFSLVFMSATGYAVGANATLFRTTDSGQSWKAMQLVTESHFFGVDFTSPAFGYAVGSEGTIITTSNGGDTWTVEVSLTLTDRALGGVDVLSTGVAYSVGRDGIILKYF